LVGKDDERGEALTREKSEKKRVKRGVKSDGLVQRTRSRQETTRQEDRLIWQDYNSSMDALRFEVKLMKIEILRR
jgi:hypothetical protein